MNAPLEPERANWIRRDFHRASGKVFASLLFKGLEKSPEVGPYTYGWCLEFAPDATADEVGEVLEVATAAVAESIEDKLDRYAARSARHIHR